MSCPSSLSSDSFQAGLDHFYAGRHNAAIEIFSNLLAANPDDLESKHVLALCLRSIGKKTEAAQLLSEVTKLDPDNAEALSNFGAVLREIGQIDDSRKVLEAAVALDPANAVAHNNLGGAYIDLGLGALAKQCYEKSIAINPHYADALTNLSRIYYEEGQIEGARQLARSAISLDPKNVEAHNRMSFIQAACGDVEGCIKSVENSLQCDPNNDLSWSNWFFRILSSDTIDSHEILNRAQIWGSRKSQVEQLTNRENRPIKRIGIISGDLRVHPVGHFVAPVIKELSRLLEVFCYSTSASEDGMSNDLKSFSSWRKLYRGDALNAARTIAKDDIDVLIELSGHTGGNRLDILTHRPAPHQVSWLGYSGTTGLLQMDSILADHVLVPDGNENLYTEQVLKMPFSFLCTQPDSIIPSRSRPNRPIFGVFNNPAKFSKMSYHFWARVLKAVPGSTILFKYHYSHDRFVQRQITARICEHGIDPDRIEFAPFLLRHEHLDLISSVTAALDTHPYSGATTTLDCLTCGTPVVAWAGDRYSSRMTASLLSCIGAQELISESEDDAVDCAVRLATCEPEFDIAQMFVESPLCQTRLFTEALLETLTH